MPPPSMAYARHSTLPPNFSSGAPMGGSPFHRSITPSYGAPAHMLNVPFGTPYDSSRRHRSATPYAPATSSNLAYAQPVIAPPVDLMGAYPTPISANDGSVLYGLDAMPIPMEMTTSQDESNLPTPMPGQHHQVPMPVGMSMQQQMQQMQLPVPMEMAMPEYGMPAQYETGAAQPGWGWRSYEPGAFVPSENAEASASDYRE